MSEKNWNKYQQFDQICYSKEYQNINDGVSFITSSIMVLGTWNFHFWNYKFTIYLALLRVFFPNLKYIFNIIQLNCRKPGDPTVETSTKSAIHPSSSSCPGSEVTKDETSQPLSLRCFNIIYLRIQNLKDNNVRGMTTSTPTALINPNKGWKSFVEKQIQSNFIAKDSNIIYVYTYIPAFTTIYLLFW